MEYHVPVLRDACIEYLITDPAGVYLDLTFGGGGHSRALLDKLTPQGRLFAFDQDAEAAANALPLQADERFTLVAANFRHLTKYLKYYKVEKVHGILADLGISSHQIDTPERGFSIRFEGPLDMRMNQQSSFSATELLQNYSEQELHRIFGMYGEVKNARTLAAALVKARSKQAITTVQALKEVLVPYMPRGAEHKYLAQVFQALRIEVNEEMQALEEMLQQSADLLLPGGRLVVLSYHSLEDRLVKNFMQKGKFYGEVEKDLYGHDLKPLHMLTKKPIVPSEAEITQNSRARSAKLRVAERR
jgi:16S rRNA (cytosine1402-N4)-methyltransferase